MALSIHALNIGIVITALDTIAGSLAGAGAGQAANRKPGAGADGRAATAIHGGSGRGAKHGAKRRAARAALLHHAARGGAAQLRLRILAALEAVSAKLVEALAASRQ